MKALSLLLLSAIILVAMHGKAIADVWEDPVGPLPVISGYTVHAAMSDGYGQHLIGVYSDGGHAKLRYYLFGNDGGVVWYRDLPILENRTLYSTITAFAGTVYAVVTTTDNSLSLFHSPDGGDTWSAREDFSRPGITSLEYVDAVSDLFGVHIVWKGAWNGGDEVWYVQYRPTGGFRVETFKNITDFSSGSGSSGSFPKVLTTGNRVVVSFIGNDAPPATTHSGMTRDGDLSISPIHWDDFQRQASVSGVDFAQQSIGIRGNQIYMIMIQASGNSQLIYRASRGLDDPTWLIEPPIGPYGGALEYYNFRREATTWADTLHITYAVVDGSESIIYHNAYRPPSGWSEPPDVVAQTPYDPSRYPYYVKPTISSSRTGAYMFWEYGEFGFFPQIWMRRNVYYMSGSVSENMFWTGHNWVDGDLTIQAGHTVTIKSGSVTNILNGKHIVIQGAATLVMEPGSRLNFESGAGLVCYGQLQALGTSASPIVLGSTSPTSSWDGIVLSGASNSTLQYCNISGATMAVSAEECDPTIKNNVISNCETGIDVYVGQPKLHPIVQYNEIDDCKTGLYIHSSTSSEVTGNSIHDNIFGAILFQCSPVFRYNVIQKNQARGITSEQADPRFGDMVVGDRGCNTIRYNTTQDGTADFYATGGNPFFGLSDGGSKIQGGFNSIYSDNPGRCIVVVEKGAYMTAHANWWGQYPPDDHQFCMGDGKVDYSYALSSSPERDCQGPVAGGALTADAEEQMLQSAMVQRGDRNYSAALTTYANFVANRPNSSKVFRALRELRQTYRDYSFWTNDSTLRNQLFDYLTATVGNHPNLSLRLAAKMLLADELHMRHAWATAITRYEQVIQALPNTNDERVGLFSIFDINAYGLDDTVAAGSTLQLLETKYPDDPHTKLAELRYAQLTTRVSNGLARQSNQGAGMQSSIPAQYRLEQNYPNPFNPLTTINYALATDGHVSLKVYDVLGREIATLVDSFVQAGNHQVAFNASDLASGIYFYRIQAGTYTDVKKLVVLK